MKKLPGGISEDLKIRVFSFHGSIIIYSHLQAAGLTNNHRAICFWYRELENSVL